VNYKKMAATSIILAAGLMAVPNDAALAAEPLPTMKSLKLIPVPRLRQASDYTCGVCALQAVLAYYGEDMREDELARALKATPRDGTRYQAIAVYGKKHGYKVEIKKNSTIAELETTIRNGLPAICLLQAWAENKSRQSDYSKNWEDGHYVVAVGFDKERIYFMDPSTTGNYAYVNRKDFLKRWHDTDGKERLNNFFMVLSKKPVAPTVMHDPDAITEMK